MIVRDSQQDDLEKARYNEFIERVVKHLNEHFAERCAALGEERVRASIALGIKNAGQYGLTSERDVVRYLNHMYVLGFDFDTAYPWAASILQDPGIAPAVKMDWLSGRTRQELPEKP